MVTYGSGGVGRGGAGLCRRSRWSKVGSLPLLTVLRLSLLIFFFINGPQLCKSDQCGRIELDRLRTTRGDVSPTPGLLKVSNDPVHVPPDPHWLSRGWTSSDVMSLPATTAPSLHRALVTEDGRAALPQDQRVPNAAAAAGGIVGEPHPAPVPGQDYRETIRGQSDSGE